MCGSREISPQWVAPKALSLVFIKSHVSGKGKMKNIKAKQRGTCTCVCVCGGFVCGCDVRGVLIRQHKTEKSQM